MYLIGIDLGTSGTKSVLFDEKGNTISSYTYEYPMYQPQNGWAEQDPKDWWDATCVSIKAIMHSAGTTHGVKPEDVAGIGISGQMHGLVMLDREDNVLRRSIIWCDQRTGEECEQITETLGRDKLIEITANPALTGFTLSKILWVKNHEPELFEKCAKIMLPKDYVRYMLTGEFATEVSDASGMQLLNIAERRWSKEVMDAFDLDSSMFGKMYESYEVTGRLTEGAAALCGLKAGIPVVGGAGDQAAGAVGNGIVREGVVSSTIGTSGVVFAHTDNISIDPKGRVHTFCHAVPDCWHIMGVTQGAGLSLQWFRNNFCASEVEAARMLGQDPYILMDKQAESVPAGANGVIYLPYLMGERTPHLDPDCRGLFYGLSAMHTRKDMLRAVMEGVGYSLMDCMDIINEMGINPSEVRASGGGGKSPLWRQMQCDMFGCNVTTVNSSEGPALGVAILAAVGAGIYSSVPEACDAIISIKNSIQPDVENGKVYARMHGQYQKIYEALKPIERY